MSVEACPHCGTSLIGNPIPEAWRDCYGSATHFRREIGVEVAGEYDGVLFWQCPDCAGQWHRWPVGSRLRLAAARHMVPKYDTEAA